MNDERINELADAVYERWRALPERMDARAAFIQAIREALQEAGVRWIPVTERPAEPARYLAVSQYSEDRPDVRAAEELDWTGLKWLRGVEEVICVAYHPVPLKDWPLPPRPEPKEG